MTGRGVYLYNSDKHGYGFNLNGDIYLRYAPDKGMYWHGTSLIHEMAHNYPQLYNAVQGYLNGLENDGKALFDAYMTYRRESLNKSNASDLAKQTESALREEFACDMAARFVTDVELQTTSHTGLPLNSLIKCMRNLN